MKISKSRYILSFLGATCVLALVRCAFPSVANDLSHDAPSPSVADSCEAQVADGKVANGVSSDSIQSVDAQCVDDYCLSDSAKLRSRFFKADGTLAKNRIFSVPGFQVSFPDQNDVQLEAAQKHGVKPVVDREDAENRKSELVFVGGNMYFYVDWLRNSIPYLVPRASVLLQDIGQAFFDSLQMKGVPLHKLIVTSVLRSKADVETLRGRNGNATQNSCHLYGTTFDVCYNRYKTVEAPGEQRRAVRNDTLKWVLSEVLRDMREKGRCYVKYEVKQGCFHITVR